MADENLSFQITFEEIEKLTQEVTRAGKSIESLGEFGREAGRGIDIAASSAVEAAEAILGIDSAARQAAAAVDELTQPRDIAVDTSEIEDALVASERLRAEIEEFAAPQSIAIDFTGLDEANRAFEESFAAAQNLRSEIEEFESAKGAVDGVTSSVDNLGESLQAAAGQADASVGAISGSFGKVGSSIAGIAKAAGAAALGFAAFKSVEQIGQAISGSMKTAVREFVEAERATVNLSSALASLGQFSGENVAKIRAFADEIARTTVFEDDAVVSAAALIAQLGRLSGTELTGATQSAVQLAAVLGKDLQSAALLVAKAAAGSGEALSRYGIVIDDSIPAAQRFAEIQRQIADRFGGRAQAELLTFGGGVQQLKKSWNELLESFGRTITIFQPAINALTAGLQRINDLLNIPEPRNFLDAIENIEAVTEAMDELTLATKRRNEALRAGAPTVNIEPDDIFRARIRKELPVLEQSIIFAVDGGNVKQVEAIFQRIEELRLRALEAGEADIARDLDRLGALRGRKVEVDFAAEGAADAAKQVQALIDLVVRAQTIAGAGVDTSEIIETKGLEADTTKVEELRARFVAAINAMETEVGRAATSQAGGVNPAAPALELFNAVTEARLKFIEDFGTIPAEIEAIFKQALDRATAIAKQFPSALAIPPVDFEIGIKVADPDAITADIQRLVGDSLTRASQTRFEPIDTSAFRDISTSAEEAQEKIDAIRASTINLEPAFEEASQSALGFASALAGGFESAFASILDGTAKFKTVFGGIFKALADEAIRQIARIAAATAILFVINPGAGLAAAFKRALGKPGQSLLPGPITVPIEPEVPAGAQKAVDDLIRGIRVPTIDPIIIGVETNISDALAAIQAIQLPTIDSPTVTVNVDTSALGDIRLPNLDPLIASVEFDVPTLGDLTAAVDLQVPALDPVTADVVLNVPALEPIEAEVQFDAPTVDPILAALEFAAPQVDALSVPVNFDFPALEPLSLEAAIQLQALDLPDLEPLSVALSVGRLPELEPQAVAVAADFDARAFARSIEAPSFDIGASFRRPEFEVSDSSTLAFSRFIQSARAPRPPAPPPQSVREIIPRPVNIQITGAVNDGISVRRQLTSGALRTELERSLRRST